MLPAPAAPGPATAPRPAAGRWFLADVVLPFAAFGWLPGWATSIFWGLFPLAVAAAILMNGTGMLADHAADLAMVYGSYTIAFLLLTAGLAGLLVSTGPSRTPEPSGT